MPIDRRVRVLIVDDSAVMRTLLRRVLATAVDIEVVDAVGDGAAALRAIEAQHPDVVLLDIEMPGMDGIKTLRQIRATRRGLPVIMCSSLTQRGAAMTIEALARGASDYVAKPSGQASPAAAMAQLAAELLPRIHVFGSHLHQTLDTPATIASASLAPLPPVGRSLKPEVVVIGVSTGGPAALEQILPHLPASFPLPILLVQHMPKLFTGPLAQRLNLHSKIEVREAQQSEVVTKGVAYIAPGDWHMTVSRDRGQRTPCARIKLNQGPPVNYCRPSVDILFQSAAAVYSGHVLALILTGMGSDGLEGSRTVRSAGGMVLAQDKASSAVWGMPGAVAEASLATRILPLDKLAQELVFLSGRAEQQVNPHAHQAS